MPAYFEQGFFVREPAESTTIEVIDPEYVRAFDNVVRILEAANEHGLHVSLSVHGVPTDIALRWLQDKVLDQIDRGPGGNPPTGHGNIEAPNGFTLGINAFLGERYRQYGG